MVKGISKRVIVVRSPDQRIFEQAIFIIREDFAGQTGMSEQDILREADRAARRYLNPNRENTRRGIRGLRGALFAAAGAAAAAIAWFAVWMVRM